MITGPSTNKVYDQFKKALKLIKLPEPEEDEDSSPGIEQIPAKGQQSEDSDKGQNEQEREQATWGDETGDQERILSLYAGMGEVEDYSNNNSSNMRQTQITATLIQKAAIMAKSAGMRYDNPVNALAETFEEEFNDEQSWNTKFRNLIMDITRKEDYTWKRPNKKWMQQGIYMPVIQGPKDQKSIVIGIDVSGSINEEQLRQMEEELSNSLSDVSFKAQVILCDTQIKRIQKVTNEDLPFNISVRAGGGTNLEPIFEKIAQKQWNPVMTIIFTDMEFNWSTLRRTFNKIGGNNVCGEVVFLNFGQALTEEKSLRYYGTHPDTFHATFYSNIINMQTRRQDDEQEEQGANLIAEPLPQF